MWFKIFSIIITGLFFWIIYPYKLLRKLRFERNRDLAIVQCRVLAKQHQKRHYVVQNKNNFYVEKRDNLRQWNRKNKRNMMPVYDFDYRNAIVYHCDANGSEKYYERITKK